MRRSLLILALIMTVLGWAVAAQAQINLYGDESTEGLGSFIGYLEYVPSSDTEAQLYVALFNDSDSLNGGYITAFALNNPGNRVDSVEIGELWPEGWQVLGGKRPYDGVKAVPFGVFDFGAGVGKSFLGGGSPQDGIYVEEYKEFVFNLTGTGLMDLWANDFMLSLSSPSKGSTQAEFVVRFKGFLDDGSDKVVGLGGWIVD